MNWLKVGVALYGLLGIIGVRPVAGHFAYAWKDKYKTRPTGDHWFFATLFAIALCATWPAVGLMYGLWYTARGVVIAFDGGTAWLRIGAERKAIKEGDVNAAPSVPQSIRERLGSR